MAGGSEAGRGRTLQASLCAFLRAGREMSTPALLLMFLPRHTSEAVSLPLVLPGFGQWGARGIGVGFGAVIAAGDATAGPALDLV